MAVLVVVLVIGWVLSRSGGDSDKTDTGGSQPAFDLVEVQYRVYGTADSADITIETPSGTSQQQDVAVPLKNKQGDLGLGFRFPPGSFVYISAQNNGSGSISCQIVVDGIVTEDTSSYGEYAIATCDGSA